MLWSKKDKKQTKEYLKEYVRVCETIKKEDLYKKRITIIYDEVIPDLFVEIDVENKKVKKVNYDIYANRIKEVMVKFPNNKTENFKIAYVKEIEDNKGIYTASWDVPYVLIKYNKLEIPLSLIDLITEGIDVYLIDYKLKGDKSNGK